MYTSLTYQLFVEFVQPYAFLAGFFLLFPLNKNRFINFMFFSDACNAFL